MRRVAHHLFTILSALSLLICIGACVLWVRGIGGSQGWVLDTDWSEFIFQSGNGLVRLEVALDSSPVDKGWGTFATVGPRALWDDWTRKPNRAGLGLWITRTIGPPKGRWKYGGRTIVLAYLPQWLIVPITALLPGWWMVARIRGGTQKERRKRLGLCPTCGYDLRATPAKSGPLFVRRPECGAGRDMHKSQC